MAIVGIIIVGTSMWMYFESRSFAYNKRDLTGMSAMGPIGWFVVGILLWIVAFPLYLASRDKLRAAGESRRARLIAEDRYRPQPPSKLGPVLVGLVGSVLVLGLAAAEREGPRAVAETAPTVPSAVVPVAPEQPARDLNLIPDGTYAVGTEIKPGLYRVGRYWARQDAQQQTIANDVTTGCPSLMRVLPTDAYVTIQGDAIAAELRSVDPIANSCSAGTFVVGTDIAPGRYRLKGDGMTYWARMNSRLDTIANDIGNGQRIVVVRPKDFALKINGVESIERID